MLTISKLPIIVLCGGEANRLKSINSPNIPKILFKKNDTCFIEYLIRNIIKKEINEVYFLCDERVNLIKEVCDYLVKKYKIDCYCFYEGPDRLGTGGAIKKFLKSFNSIKRFHLTFGDSLTIFDPKKYSFILDNFANKTTMSVFLNTNSLDQKNIFIQNNKIIQYQKNSLNKDFLYIDYGFMTFFNDIFLKYKKDKFDLSEIIKKLVNIDSIIPFYCDKRFFEIGTPDSYKEFLKINDSKLKSHDYI